MNILVMRVSAIGDVIHTIPAVLLLKKTIPGVKIGWVVQQKAVSLLIDQPFIDQLFILPDNFLRWQQIGETKKIIEQLRQTRWDAIIDFQGLEKTTILYAGLSGKKYGFTPEHARSSFSTWFTYKQTKPVYQNIIQKNLDLASYVAYDLCGITSSPAAHLLHGPDLLRISEQDKVFIDSWLQEQQLDQFMLLAPNTTWDSKHWPVHYWFSLIKKLCDEKKSIVLIGTFFNGMAQELVLMIKEHGLRVHFLPVCSLLAVAYAMRRATVVIAPDTGLLHLADLIDVQSLGLFGPTNAVKHGPFLRQKNRVAAIQVTCPHIYQKKHGQEQDCMLQLLPDHVLQRINYLEQDS